jgi:beta-lactamase superfamily II metal-dependent hydrolase
MKSNGARGGRLATLKLYYCGRGDTILLRTPGGCCGLIDSNLTRDSGASERVLGDLDGIDCLAFVCLTHPDLDHFRGMRALLESRFVERASARLKVGQFWDSGVKFTLFWSIAKRQRRGDNRSQELKELYRLLWRHITAGFLGHRELKANSLSGPFDGFWFLALAPDQNRVDRFNEQVAEDIFNLPLDEFRRRAEETNDLSVVLAMFHDQLPVNIILGGDANAGVWHEALATWARVVGPLRRGAGCFDAVKVSHHGAARSLYPELYRSYCKGKNTVALLSVGPDDPLHPHPDVLDLLKEQGIRVYTTCRSRRPAGRGSDPLVLLGSAGPPAVPGHDCADVVVSIWADGTLTAEPEHSLLQF